MALAPSMNASFSSQLLSPLGRERFCVGFERPCSLILSPPCPSRSFAPSLSRRRQLGPAACAARRGKKKVHRKGSMPGSTFGKDDDLDGDAFEALFKQLEEDLKNDKDLSFDDDDLEISEEDFARLEKELKEALGVDYEDDIEVFPTTVDNVELEGDNDDGDDAEQVDDDAEQVDDGDAGQVDEDEEVEKPVELKRWQLRRLASALKAGKRKTSIKSLAAELGLDRAIVLELLREPPPDLLMLSATLPDEPEHKEMVSRAEVMEVVEDDATEEAAKPEAKVDAPLHVMHQTWAAQKRLKKVQVQTLENVYRKTKRPTNAMISSIVQVTSLPRKRIVKWFEDKRAEDGVPDQRAPFKRPEPETASSN